MMSEKAISIITILLLTVVPLILFLLHTFLSTRKSWLWSLIVPVIWASLGTWIMVADYKEMGFASELFIFFLAGVFILVIVTLLLRWRRRREI
jgi:hypothetical protein